MFANPVLYQPNYLPVLFLLKLEQDQHSRNSNLIDQFDFFFLVSPSIEPQALDMPSKYSNTKLHAWFQRSHFKVFNSLTWIQPSSLQEALPSKLRPKTPSQATLHHFSLSQFPRLRHLATTNPIFFPSRICSSEHLESYTVWPIVSCFFCLEFSGLHVAAFSVCLTFMGC